MHHFSPAQVILTLLSSLAGDPNVRKWECGCGCSAVFFTVRSSDSMWLTCTVSSSPTDVPVVRFDTFEELDFMLQNGRRRMELGELPKEHGEPLEVELKEAWAVKVERKGN